MPFIFLAPAASALTLQFSQRVVIIVGGLIAASGMLLASLDLSLPWLYITMGILQGSTQRTHSKVCELHYLLYSHLKSAKLILHSSGAAALRVIFLAL